MFKTILKRNISILLIIITFATCFANLGTIEAKAGDYSAWSSIFDPAYYSSHNAEANAYAKGNVDALWNYFVSVGIPRGDQASAEFNLAVYKQNYADLRAAFGNNNIQYYVHYAQHGKAEGRIASSQTATPAAATTTYTRTYDGRYGSAGNLSGRTILVSVFVSTPTYKWSTSNNNDLIDMNTIRSKIGIATNYIVQQCANYNCHAEFIYDWSLYPDLIYMTSTNTNSTRYRDKKATVTSVVNEKALLEKYQADNIVYLYIVNSDANNTTHNNTYLYKYGSGVTTEIVTLHKVVDYGSGGTFLLPSSTAHEILHAFGAPDLYTASNSIPQAYVDYLVNNNIKDIMRTTNYGNSVSAPILATTAYYLGLTPSAPDVATFGLGLTEKVR